MANLKIQILFLTISLVCGTYCLDDAKSNNSASIPSLKDQQPQKKLGQSGETVILKPTMIPAVETGKITNSSSVKATTPKTAATLKEPTMPEIESDVSDFGDSMFVRAAYLLTGISVLVLLYFVWKSFRLRRPQTHIHKYGVVASREDLEMTSLGFGSEDEEDDTTHFDIGKHQRS